MGIVLSAITTQFISDLILPDGSSYSAGTSTELLAPDGSFTLEDIRASAGLQSAINSGDVLLLADGDIIVQVDTVGVNYISTYGGVINQDIQINGNISADTISAEFILSGGTDLGTVINNVVTASTDVTRVQPGVNTTTGGTDNFPTVNLVDNPSINNISISGTGSANAFSGTSISADTLFSGSTDLSEVFSTFKEIEFGTTSPATNKLWFNTNNTTLFGFDSTRSKWLTIGEPSTFAASRNSGNVNNQFLRHYNGTPYNLVPAPLPFNVTLVQLTLRGQSSQSWRGFVTTGTSLPADIIINIDSGGSTFVDNDTYNIDLNAGDDVYFYCSGTSIDYPRLDLYVKRRGE